MEVRLHDHDVIYTAGGIVIAERETKHSWRSRRSEGTSHKKPAIGTALVDARSYRHSVHVKGHAVRSSPAKTIVIGSHGVGLAHGQTADGLLKSGWPTISNGNGANGPGEVITLLRIPSGLGKVKNMSFRGRTVKESPTGEVTSLEITICNKVADASGAGWTYGAHVPAKTAIVVVGVGVDVAAVGPEGVVTASRHSSSSAAHWFEQLNSDTNAYQLA